MFFRQFILIFIAGLFAPQCWSAATVQEYGIWDITRKLLFKCIFTLSFFPFYASAVLQLHDLDVTIPSWTVESIGGDNVVYSFPLVAADVTHTMNTYWASTESSLLMEDFPESPVSGDKRCLDDNCNYYLDISEVKVKGGTQEKKYESIWGSGGLGGFIGDNYHTLVGGLTIDAAVLATSKISIKKRHTGVDAKYPTKPKTVSFKFAVCNPGARLTPPEQSGYYSSDWCNWGPTSTVLGPGIQINVTVPPPTLPKVQCYMSPWSNNIDFQPVTVPVETGRAGAATWPLGGGTFTGVEKQSASLSVQCSNIATDVSSLPLKVSLKGNGWEYGNNGELFFGTERNIAVATALKMNANTGSLALDNDGSGCDSYWRNSGNNNFEMSALNTGNYLMSGGNQCSFTHQLPTPRSVMEEFRFTVDAVLGVSTATAVNAPEYRKHQGTLMLEVTMQ